MNLLVITVFLSVVLVVESCDTFNNTLIIATDIGGYKIKKRITGSLERKAFGDRVIQEVFIRNQNIPVFETDSIRHLVHLEKVSIWYSSVQEIQPRAFRNVPELEQVYMNHCELTVLPQNVFNLVPSLIQLRFHNNMISVIGEGAFGNLTNLRWVNISHNNLVEWNEKWFDGSTEIETIDFSYNKIKEIPNSGFEGLPRLKNIHFDYNHIDKIGRDAFKGLSFIQYLGLSQNGLIIISPEAFSHGTRINFLHIEANYVSLVPEDLLKRVRVSNIAMHGNPLNCYCFKEMMRWFGENHSKVIYSNEACNRGDLPICVEPADIFDHNCSNPVGASSIAKYFSEFINSRPSVDPACFRLE